MCVLFIRDAIHMQEFVLYSCCCKGVCVCLAHKGCRSYARLRGIFLLLQGGLCVLLMRGAIHMQGFVLVFATAMVCVSFVHEGCRLYARIRVISLLLQRCVCVSSS